MKAPKDSKGRLLTRRRAVYNMLDRQYATHHHRPGGKGDRQCHAGGDGAGGSDRWVVMGSDGGLPNNSDGR